MDDDSYSLFDSDNEQLLADQNQQAEPNTPSLLEDEEELPSPPKPKRLKLGTAQKDDGKKLTRAETLKIKVGDRVFSEFPVEGPHHGQWYWGQVKKRFEMKHMDDGTNYFHYQIVYDDGDIVNDFDPTVFGISQEKWVKESTPDVALDNDSPEDELFQDDPADDDDLFSENNEEELASYPKEINKSKLPVKQASGLIENFDEQGSEIPVIKYEKEVSFLRWHCPGKVLIKTGRLADKNCKIETTFSEFGNTYCLIATKIEKQTQSYGHYEYAAFRAHYIRYDNKTPEQAIAKTKQMLETLGNFAALPSNKVVSRLDLLVSPAARDGRKNILHRVVDLSKFELIQECNHYGCGFIPKELLASLLGENSQEAIKTTAVQVRIVAPRLGIFKGMLVSKLGIKKIQLPPSMLKVPASKEAHTLEAAYVLFKRLSPTKSSEQMDRKINPNVSSEPTKSSKKTKLGDGASNVLSSLGVSDETLIQYRADSCIDWQMRNHSYCVGVCDPTDALPPGSVFVTGLGVGSNVSNQYVFVTRDPCTEPRDGQVLKRIVVRPCGMSQEKWNELCSWHFGVIIFAKPDPEDVPIPEIIANGDLDGDLYLVLWDSQILAEVDERLSLEEPGDQAQNASDDKNIGTSVTFKGKKYTVEGIEGESYILKGVLDSFFEQDTIAMQKKQFAGLFTDIKKVLGHRNLHPKKDPSWIELECENESGKKFWGIYLQMQIQNGAPQAVNDYAKNKELLDQPVWKELKKIGLIDLNEISKIIGHRAIKNEKKAVFHLVHHNGDEEWCKVSDLKASASNGTFDTGAIIAKYCEDTKLLHQKGFEWVKKIQKNSETVWFDKAQELLSDRNRRHGEDLLRKKLHTLFGKLRASKGVTNPDTMAIGRAYKLSNDIMKHGGKVNVPWKLRNFIGPELLPLVNLY